MVKRAVAHGIVMMVACSVAGPAAASSAGPVFAVEVRPAVVRVEAGGTATMTVGIAVADGWHINTDRPGDGAGIPTTVQVRLPRDWRPASLRYPGGETLETSFSSGPLEVWAGHVDIAAKVAVPTSATGAVPVAVEVVAQACDDTRCLPPETVTARVRLEVIAATPKGAPNRVVAATMRSGDADPPAGTSAAFASKSLPLLLVTVFLAGLALNLTPCIYPLIPVTLGFFAQQAGQRRGGGTLGLAAVYVLGMALTYSGLGVAAALTGQLFGSALQQPLVVAVLIAVLLALAASMFGAWELRVPGWAQRAAGGRGGGIGALLMGLLVGFVAAPCIGPFVLGLLTFVGQRGDPFFGFLLFFTLALGLGAPFLVLGSFAGAVSRLPSSGPWMVGVRRIFGVVLVAMAAYFARPLLPGATAAWPVGLVLVLGAVYLLVVERTGHEQPVIDRAVRLTCLAMTVIGLWLLPLHGGQREPAQLWRAYDPMAVESAIASGGPVIVDFYADWCVACRELDEKTFSDSGVSQALAPFARFKVDQTRYDDAMKALAARFGVRGLPTVIVYRKAREAFRITGFEPPSAFLARLRGSAEPQTGPRSAQREET